MSKPCSTWRVQIWVIRLCKRECCKTCVHTYILCSFPRHHTLPHLWAFEYHVASSLEYAEPIPLCQANSYLYFRYHLHHLHYKAPHHPTPNYKGFLCVPKVHSNSPIIALIGPFMSVFPTTLYVLQWQRPFPSSSLCIKSLTHVKHSNICGINYQQIITYLTNKYLQ